MKGDVRLTQSGRDGQWKRMVENADLAGLSCVHLGGDSGIGWLIEIDQGLKGEPTGVTTRVRANGGDMQGTPIYQIFPISNVCLALFLHIG